MTDWSKVREYASRLEEHAKEIAVKAHAFDPKQLVTKSRAIRTVQDPETGEVIKYGGLQFADLVEINRAETNEDKSMLILYKMLHKAYSDLTLDDVKAFGLEDITRLLKLMMGPGGFFQAVRQSANGSTQVPKPSESASSPTSTATASKKSGS